MTHAELATIEALADAATPGPWTACPHREYVFGPDTNMVVEMRGVGAESCGQRREGDYERNCDFIAAARQSVPALLAEVRRLQEYERRAFAQEAELLKTAGKQVALEAEAKRLREESQDHLRRAAQVALRLVDAQDEVARLQAVVADQALTIGTQKDELARLREENTRLQARSQSAALMQVDAALATLARARDSAGGPLSSSDYEEFVAMVRACREPKP